jgi:hypothetical protein
MSLLTSTPATSARNQKLGSEEEIAQNPFKMRNGKSFPVRETLPKILGNAIIPAIAIKPISTPREIAELLKSPQPVAGFSGIPLAIIHRIAYKSSKTRGRYN